MEQEILDCGDGRRIAYRRVAGAGPGVVFLGGFRSDMTGTKAAFLDGWARERGRAFLRFDYRGHGASSGSFEDGCIGDWLDDAAEAVTRLTEGPQILVGSSMGGWIAMLLAQRLPERVAGLVGIAAAPDFTVDSIWPALGAAGQARLLAEGRIEVDSAYSPFPYIISRRLIEDGRRHLLLRAPLRLAVPVRLLHGTDDADVPMAVAVRLLAHAEAPDLRLTLVKGGDHRLSGPAELALLAASVVDLGG